MPRTTDDLNQERFQPLGERVERKPAAAPAQPEWRQKPGAAEGVQENRDGRLRTDPFKTRW